MPNIFVLIIAFYQEKFYIIYNENKNNKLE